MSYFVRKNGDLSSISKTKFISAKANNQRNDFNRKYERKLTKISMTYDLSSIELLVRNEFDTVGIIVVVDCVVTSEIQKLWLTDLDKKY